MLAAIVEDFNAMALNEWVQLLPEPARECQLPISSAVQVGGSGKREPVAMSSSASHRAPTSRGLAGALTECIDGLTAQDIRAVSDGAARLRLTGSSGCRRG